MTLPTRTATHITRRRLSFLPLTNVTTFALLSTRSFSFSFLLSGQGEGEEEVEKEEVEKEEEEG